MNFSVKHFFFGVTFFFGLWFPTGDDSFSQELGTTINTNGTNVTGVTFRVWAPNARDVRVAGEFNGWSTNGQSVSSNNAVWSLTITNARPGHAYKYVITTTNNTVLWKKDPRGRQVRTMTGGVPGQVTGSSLQASVIYDPNAFDWSGDTFIPPKPEDIVMYELHVGTFYDPTPNDGQPATFDDAIQKLDYLKGLGINMIALMPVQEFNGRHSWGYNPSDPFAIEETYGGPDAFKRFVKAAHQKGMAVQVDVVHNHYGDLSDNTSAWTSLKTSDLENFDGGEPYFYNQFDEATRPGISKTKWGPRPRYSDPNVRAYIKDNIKMYLDEYKVWALRWDSPRNITGYQANPTSAVIGDPNTPIDEAVSMMTDIHNEIRSLSRTNSDRYYSIAEDANSPGGYHAHWEISYHDAIFSRLLLTNHPPTGTTNDLPPPFNRKYTTNDPSMGNLKWRIENKEDPGFRVTFLENHDKCGDHNSVTDGKRLAHDFDTNDPTSLTAKRKTLVAAAATLASAGTPMLWMGQEQLADGDFNDKKALDWGRAQQFAGIVRFHRDMIHLRTNLPALKTASTNINQSPFVAVVTTNQTNGLLAFRRSDGTNSNNDVLVAINFSPSNNTLPTNARAGGFTNVILNSHTTNYDAGLTNTGPLPGTVLAANSNATIGPWSVILFAKTNVPLPATDANGNGLDDGIDLLTGGRAALPGSFNGWDTNTPAMKWDNTSKVYRYVARFSSPGTNRFKAYTTNWAPDPDASFVNSSAPATWEITFNPSNNSYGMTHHGTNAGVIPEAWSRFHFETNSVAGGVDPDGDGWSNLQEFQRGSDPTVHEKSRLAAVGNFNGWNWSAAADTNSPVQMRYQGHGLWKFFRWFPLGTTDRNFKISQGPTADDPNWGPSTNGAVYQGSNNFTWLTNLETWQVLTFNERNSAYSIETLPPNPTDSDADGMPDEWEIFSGLNPFANDSTADADSDGVFNRAEYERGSSARDGSDHYAAMWMPGDGDWNFTAKRQMVWNPDSARWEFILYSAPRSFEVRFAADSGYSTSWGWPASGSSNGISVRDPATNITVTVSSTGYHRIRFDEVSGRYQVGSMGTTDTDGDSMPDEWERFYSLNPNLVSDALTDLEPDGVLNKFEYERGSHPRVADRSGQMALPGNWPLFLGDTSDSWSPTNPRKAMRWNTHNARWEAMVFAPGASTFEFKFAAGDWGNGTWGWNSNSVAGQSSKWPNGPNGGNISYSFPARGYYVVRFEEYQGSYAFSLLNQADENQNELPDEWEFFSGATDPGGNHDSDAWVNRSEYYRGIDPFNSDPGSPAKRMTVTGNNNAFHNPHWQPASTNMTWSDQRLRWEWSGTFSSSANLLFKFSQATNNDWTGGKSWGSGTLTHIAVDGGSNIAASVTGGLRYLIHFDDSTGIYGLIPYPTSLDWLTSNSLANLPQNPWPVDTDKDGNNNLLEFVLGGNPNLAQAQTNRLINTWTTNQGGTNRLVLRWNERTNAATVQAQWQTSLTSTNWTNLTPSNIGGVSGGMQQKEASVPIDSTNRKFLRLRVTGP